MNDLVSHPALRAHAHKVTGMLHAPVFVVDPDPGFRNSVLKHFGTHGLQAEGFDTAARLIDVLRRRRPGCIIADMDVPDMRGFELQQYLARNFCHIPLLLLARETDAPTIVHAMRQGACSFIVKPTDLGYLFQQTRAALEAVLRMGERELRKQTLLCRIRALTAREQHVLKLALSGKSNKEISLTLDISPRTVETHRSHLIQKTGVGNLLELAHVFISLEDFFAAAPEGVQKDTTAER